MPQSVLIIGAGMTGALCASSLSRILPNISLKICDKARGAGGRMSTTRSNGPVLSQADLGAQYITIDKDNLEKYNGLYSSLIQGHILKPLEATVEGMHSFPNGTVQYVVPHGMGSLVKHFLSDLPSSVIKFNQHVSSIELQPDGIGLLVKNVDGTSETADIVVSTIPVPQFLKLERVVNLLTDSQLTELKKVSYSSRFALIWFYESTDGFPFPDWGAKYLDDDIFRYVAIDNVKRNKEDPPAIVFHTSVQFGAKNAHRNKDDLLNELEERAHSLFPQFPNPVSSKCHKWLYSQVVNGYPGKPGCLIVRSCPTLILAGDAFATSNMNGCIASAEASVDAILKLL